MDDKIDQFAEAARFYQHRPAYPPDAIQWIVDELYLDGCGRMLDVGCGTGHVCCRFAEWFETIVAIDPSEPMLDEARNIATCGGMADKFSFQKMHAEELPDGLGRFRLVTFGASFHRVRQQQVLEAVYDMIEPGGGLALLFPGVPWRGNEPWKNVLRQTVKDWTGRFLGGSFVPSQAAVCSSAFGGCHERDFHEDHAWSLEELIGYMRSTSFASSSALADRTEKFYHDLRSRLLDNRPDGLFPDVSGTTVVVAVRKKQFDSGPVDSSEKRVSQQPHAADAGDPRR